MTTFAQQADIYLAKIATRKRRPVKATSLATIRSLIRAASPVLGRMELEAIKSGALKTLAETLCEQDYAPNSIQSIVTTAKLIVESDVDQDGDPKHLRKWNNDRIFESVPPEADKSPVITASELEAVIAKARPVIREFIITQAASGCRKGELLALRVSDFDREIGLLHVSRTLSRHGETATKTKSGQRDVDIAPEIVAMLTAMLGDRTTGRLFDVTLDEMRRAFEDLDIKSHSLRHFRYTNLQKCYEFLHPAIHNFWIGHSMPGMAKRYGHIIEDVDLRQQMVRRVGLGFNLPTVVSPTEQLEHVEVSA